MGTTTMNTSIIRAKPTPITVLTRWLIASLVFGPLLLACGGSGSGGNSLIGPATIGNTGVSTSNPLRDVTTVNPDAPYADVLYRCALAETDGKLCNLETLPLLGMEIENPAITDIMNRLLVSHDWMATRFEELLTAYPQEMRTLFRGLTAIVIDADIRPAHYRSDTGAIYLDPAYLWTSNLEKQTINKQKDYRAGFSDPLAFRSWGRYLKDGEYAYDFGSLDDSSSRSLEHVVLINARLLLHELAHVNDFLPYDSYGSINTRHTVYQAIDNLPSGRLSDRLTAAAPLSSELLYRLAGVMYRGNTPESELTEVTATQVGNEFEMDATTDHYAYSSQFEDVAMLFEVAMMKYFWDIDYEVAFVEPTGAEAFCDDYLIGWGRQSWLGDTDVKQRAIFVTDELMPTIDMSLFYQDLSLPSASRQDWCLPRPSNASGQNAKTDHLTPVNPEDFERRPH